MTPFSRGTRDPVRKRAVSRARPPRNLPNMLSSQGIGHTAGVAGPLLPSLSWSEVPMRLVTWLKGGVDREVVPARPHRGNSRLRSAAAAILGTLVAGSIAPSAAHAAGYVKSVEYVEVTLASGVGSVSRDLNKGQNVASCVPFASAMVSGTSSEYRNAFTDVSFQAGPARVTVQRSGTTGTVSVGVFVVEFDPAFVNVHQAAFTVNSGVGSSNVPIPTVNLAKAALVFYYRYNAASNTRSDFALAGRISSDTQLSFQRDTSSGAINGHYYVFEALNSEFSVQPVSLGIAANNPSNTAPITAVDTTRTLVLASYRTGYSGSDPEDGQVGVYLSGATLLKAERQFQTGGGNAISDIRAFVVELGGDVRVQRGSLSYADADAQKTATVGAVNIPFAMVWNGVGPGPGPIQSEANTLGDGESGFQRLKFAGAGTVQGDRTVGACTTDCAGVGRFEVLEWQTLAEEPVCGGSAGSWWDAAWKRRRRVAFDNSAQAENLQGFTVLIKLDNTRVTYAGSLGADIRFVDADDQTVLAHEIERWTEGGTSYVWVRVPQIDGASSRDFIWMYYDNPGAPDGQNGPAVWDGGFKMVQHLDENAGPHTDSTSNANDSVVIDVAAQGTAAGRIDGADLFNPASQDSIDVADSPTLDVSATESLTAEAWIKTSQNGTWQMVVDKKNDSGALWQIWVNFGAATFWLGDGSSYPSDQARADGTAAVADGTWHYLVGRWDRSTSTAQIFVDGVSNASETNATIGRIASANPLVIGEEGDSNRGGNFDGIIDEVRVSKVSRSNAWIRAQYLSMRDAFALYGPELGACNLRSIGTAGAYGTGEIPAQGGSTTVSVVSGSRTVVGAGAPPPAWKTANRGRGDSIDIAGVDYTILAVDSETQLRLTTPYGGADASGLAYTISRKFGTIDAWRACIDTSAGCGVDPAVPSTNLVADNRGEIGVLYKDTVFSGLGAGNGEITGIGGGAPQYKALTTDPRHFVTLTADGVNRHYGVAAAGVVIDGQDAVTKAGMIRIVADHTRIEWVEIKNVCPTNGCSSTAALKIDGSAAGVVIDSVLLHDNINGIVWSSPATTSVTVRNSIIYASTVDGIIPVNANDTVTVENCTIIGKATGGLGINRLNSAAITARNTIALHNPGGDFVGGITQSYNISSDGSAFGTGSLTGRIATNTAGTTPLRVVFMACPSGAGVGNCTSAPGTYDLHLRASTVNDAVNAGADLSALFVDDVDDQGRPGGANAWDIGADEQPGQADLVITKTDGRTSAVPGTPITYTLRITNNGPNAVTSLIVTDTVPSDILNPTFTPSEGSYYPGTGLWTGVSLPLNGFVVLTLSGTIKPSATGTLSNSATVAAGTGYADMTPGNNTDTDNDTVLMPEADLSVDKTAPPGPLPVATDFSYTITLTNNGPSDATGVTLTDRIPFEVEFLSSTPSNPPCIFDAVTRLLTCTPAGSLAPGGSFGVTIDVKAVAAGPITNVVSVSGSRPDPVPSNGTDDAKTDVYAPGTAVQFFSATSTDGRVVLQWLNPDIAGPPDYWRTEVYVRTDHFTITPTELFNQLVCVQSDENDKDSCPHDPGAGGNGTTYYYTAFVRMADASLSAPRFVKGRPFPNAGRARYAYSTGATSMAPPGVGVDAVHVASNDAALHSMGKATRANEGEWPTNWKPVSMMGPSQGRPTTIAIAIGTHSRIVYLGSQDGKVYAIDADTGDEVWSTSLAVSWGQPGTMVQAQPSGMFLAFGGNHDYILVGTRYSGGDNAFYALDRDDGDPVPGWPFSNGGADGKIGIISNQATVDYVGKRVYFTTFARSATDNRTVWCLNLDTGAKVWAKPYANVTTSPTLRGGRLYVGTIDGEVLALEAANPPTYGNVVWAFSTADGPVKGFVMADRQGQDLYFSTSNRVWALTDTGPSGTEKWGGSPLGSRNLPGPSTPILWQGRLHAGGSDGKLYTLRALDGADDLSPLTLGDGTAGIGSPTLDISESHLYVGSEAGVIHAVQMP